MDLVLCLVTECNDAISENASFYCIATTAAHDARHWLPDTAFDAPIFALSTSLDPKALLHAVAEILDWKQYAVL